MTQQHDGHRLSLPLTLNEITLDWLTQALKTRAPEAGLDGFTITNIVHGTCTKVYITLALDDAAQKAGIVQRVILKGGFEPHSRAMPYMHASEVRSYSDVLPQLGLPGPACFFAEFDAERGQGIVIIEDLNARGVTLCHPLRPHTPAQVLRRLQVLARFHARTWNSAELRDGGQWADLAEPLQTGHLQQFLTPDVWQRFLDLPRGRAASTRFHDPEWITDAFAAIVRLEKHMPQCVIHGDTHLGNLYIEPDGTPGFFDSLPHRWTPFGEVTYHIACALDQVDRRGHERALMQGYLDALRDEGVEVPTLSQAMAWYAALLPFGFCIFMVNDAVWQPEAINTAYTARFSAAMVDNDTLGALAAIA